jgi:trigger factor
VLADLGLRAVVAQEEIEASDDELDAEIDRLAERLGEKPDRVRRDLGQRGVLEAVRSDIARGKALDFLIEHAAVVDAEGNPIDLTLPEPSAEASDPTDTPDSADSVPEEHEA